ncbi:MAG: hypothetical protein AB1489_12060 [Acidobacteriota bacterium]
MKQQELKQHIEKVLAVIHQAVQTRQVFSAAELVELEAQWAETIVMPNEVHCLVCNVTIDTDISTTHGSFLAAEITPPGPNRAMLIASPKREYICNKCWDVRNLTKNFSKE